MPNIPDASGAVSSSPSAPDRFDPVFSERRVSYQLGGLDEADLTPAPLAMFRAWYDETVASGAVAEPNAMVVATVAAGGEPSARTVLLKQADPRGFVFFTNYTSRKGRELTGNPAVALLFAWVPLQRQVAVRGRAERLDQAETAAYFGSRPWGSRIGAWASHQSRPVGSRAELEARWAELAARWPDTGSPDDVPLPPFWGGWLVRPAEVEFWQGRPSRLHDRLVYLATGDIRTISSDDPTTWRVERRQP